MHVTLLVLCRQGAEKLLGVLITVGQALAYVVAGMYGDLSDLGAGNAILIVLQVRRGSASVFIWRGA